MSETVTVTPQNLSDIARRVGVTMQVLKEDYEEAKAKGVVLKVYIP